MLNQKKESFNEMSDIVKAAAVETSALEILRLLREIHAAVVNGENKVGAPRPTIRDRILEVMADGTMRAPYQAWTELKEQGVDCVEGTIASTMAALVHTGKLTRIRQNLYQAPHTHPHTHT